MARIPRPNAAVLAARARRAARQGARGRREDKWRIIEVGQEVAFDFRQRMTIAVDYLRTKVVQNISRPVTKLTGPRGGRVVLDRSKPGEYPKADTTLLMKSIFGEVIEEDGRIDGVVGTTVDYGLILETKMDRAFLSRTLFEEMDQLRTILTAPLN